MNTRKNRERYDEIWKNKLYGFCQNMPTKDTPLLEKLIERLQHYQKKPIRIIEAGAGSGCHSLILAKEGFDVTAVESSAYAVRELMYKIIEQRKRKVKVVLEDIIDYVGKLREDSCNVLYAQALLHFFASRERKHLYTELKRVQPKGGIIAVSFKAEGDALYSKGKMLEKTRVGTLVEGNDGIRRLFVNDPALLIEELAYAGYSASQNDITRWKSKGYNYEEETAQFIGFIAVKK